MNALTISTAVMSAIQLVEAGREVYETVAKLMDAAEKEKSTGTGKKAWVLEYVVKEIQEVFENQDYWLPKIREWIDAFKAAYNALKQIF